MKLLSRTFHMDRNCVQLKFANGGMSSINTIAMENKIAHNMYQHPELDSLTYNRSAVYAERILNSELNTHFITVMWYK